MTFGRLIVVSVLMAALGAAIADGDTRQQLQGLLREVAWRAGL